MLKKDYVKAIVSKIDVEDVVFKNTYGLPMGVGYDMFIMVRVNGEIHELKAHAMSQSWALVGHLRPNLDGKKYTGSNDHYKPAILQYWLSPTKRALKEYFSRFTKKELVKLYDYYYNLHLKYVG